MVPELVPELIPELRRVSWPGLLAAALGLACAGEVGTAPANEERAASFESPRLMALVKNLVPRPHWIGGEDRFWVRDESVDGVRFLIVDAATGERQDAFDHDALAAALAAAGLETAPADALPIVDLAWREGGLQVATTNAVFRCSADGSACAPGDSSDLRPGPSAAERRSPDGTRVVFVREHNLWLRDVASGRERRLTEDGEEGHAYGWDIGLDRARVARRRSGAPTPITAVNWSPDGRYLATMRVDVRAVPLRPYVTENLPPDLSFTATHLDREVVAGDGLTPVRELAIFDTRTGAKVRARIDPLKLHDFAPMHFATDQVWWHLEGGELFVITADLGGQTYGIAAIDLATGAVRTVIEESEEHYYAWSAVDYDAPNFHVTGDGAEAIFYSQRSGAGHLYLYDARSGVLKNALTAGPWVVFDLIRVDEAERLVYFTAGGREPGRDPYFPHLYRVPFGGGEPELLTPEDAAHEFHGTNLLNTRRNLDGSSQSQFSPSGKLFVDVFSTLEQPPRMVLRRADGTLVAEVLEADASALEATGWRPPERFVVKAADGATDLYGVLFKPSDFDPKMRYAVVDQTYPGPQIDSGPHSFVDSFAALTTNNAQATAEMGLVVVGLDGRGTTRRDRAFRYAFAGTEDVFGAADHKAAIENLARSRPWLDVDRVGITGASFGGYGSLRAALLFPDFFKVVVSHVGPHEYLHSVVSGISIERFFGVPGSPHDHFDLVSNIRLIERLQADLMLVYGEIDENVPLRAAMAVYEALITADKDFTTYVIPNADHGGASRIPYIVQRQRRFFREHLGGPQ